MRWLFVLAGCSSGPPARSGALVDYVGDVEPFGAVGSTAWIEERMEAYGEVYVEHYLVASNRPELCAAAQDAAAQIDEAFTEFSRVYDATTYAYSYEEQCVLVQELAAAYGEALDPIQSAGSQIFVVQAQHPDADPAAPPPAGTYLADSEGPRLFTDLLRFTVNPFATAAERMDCAADPYSWLYEFASAESYTEWTNLEEGTLELGREGETYTVELDGTAMAFGTADSVEDEPRFTVHAHYEAERCVVDLPNADVYLFDPPFW
jgi:hypothetical protein